MDQNDERDEEELAALDMTGEREVRGNQQSRGKNKDLKVRTLLAVKNCHNM